MTEIKTNNPNSTQKQKAKNWVFLIQPLKITEMTQIWIMNLTEIWPVQTKEKRASKDLLWPEPVKKGRKDNQDNNIWEYVKDVERVYSFESEHSNNCPSRGELKDILQITKFLENSKKFQTLKKKKNRLLRTN